MKRILKIKLLTIFLLTGIISNAQDIQRFLGTYSIRATCSIYNGGPFYSETRNIVIEEGIESDLLIHYSSAYTNLKAFVLNDSSFIIPYSQWTESDSLWIESDSLWIDEGFEKFFSGNGTLMGDSICFSYSYGYWSLAPYSTLFFSALCNNCLEGSTNIVLPTANQNKVCYDAIKQVIVIDETLQNQFLTFELYDMQGKVILRKSNISNFISVTNLPNGIYLYHLLQDNQLICWGKIFKDKTK